MSADKHIDKEEIEDIFIDELAVSIATIARDISNTKENLDACEVATCPHR